MFGGHSSTQPITPPAPRLASPPPSPPEQKREDEASWVESGINALENATGLDVDGDGVLAGSGVKADTPWEALSNTFAALPGAALETAFDTLKSVVVHHLDRGAEGEKFIESWSETYVAWAPLRRKVLLIAISVATEMVAHNLWSMFITNASRSDGKSEILLPIAAVLYCVSIVCHLAAQYIPIDPKSAQRSTQQCMMACRQDLASEVRDAVAQRLSPERRRFAAADAFVLLIVIWAVLTPAFWPIFEDPELAPMAHLYSPVLMCLVVAKRCTGSLYSLSAFPRILQLVRMACRLLVKGSCALCTCLCTSCCCKAKGQDPRGRVAVGRGEGSELTA